MHLARAAELPASTAGSWVIRELPGICLYRQAGGWRIFPFPVDSGAAVTERVWPRASDRRQIQPLGQLIRQNPGLDKLFKTRTEALLALEGSLGKGALSEILAC